ncbi:MAG: thermonuclease family protein [Nitrospirae bacterium]|nr:MAG: thermonuclease family protein [Nitrospirota bacterium]
MSKRTIKYIVIVLLSLASVLFGMRERFSPEVKKNTESPAKGSVRVEKVYDGDTVSVVLGGRTEKLRLIGIDAPENGQRPWGKRSKEHLQEIISKGSWNVVLEYDVVKRDKYERLLVYLRTPDGRLINEMMVRDGYAVLFTFPPNVRYADLFTRAQKEAREKMLGIWGKNGLRQAPSDYRKQHPRY